MTLLHAAAARAAEPEAPAPATDAGSGGTLSEADRKAFQRFSRPRGTYARLVGGLAFGDGVRFNNPYRLQTQLGDDAESLSLTSGYIDFGAALAFGDPSGFQHGGTVHLSVALAGVSQQVLSPGYYVAYRGANRFMGFGRLGAAYVVAPDENLGGELGLGAAFFLTGSLGVSAELIGSLFYGAGTEDVSFAVYPILSAQIGIIIDYEVLP